MQTFLYSALHFLVDGLCGYAVFARYTGDGRDVPVFLFYNFCAFALQLPLGVFLDLLRERGKGGSEKWFAFAGLLLTLAGAAVGHAFTGSVILGLGNALFHVGGGVATIRSDRENLHRGRELGIFVAPGALGLFLGSFAGKNMEPRVLPVILLAAVFFLILSVMLLKVSKSGSGTDSTSAPKAIPVTRLSAAAAAFCFLVVVLRSLLGFTVSFSWKEGFLMGFLATLCIVLGKMLGGILSARFSPLPVMVFSLTAGALCFALGRYPAFGLTALLLFNMTMPVTLQILVDRFTDLPGFSFGLLTMALFIGFVPALMNVSLPVSSELAGAAGCLLSLVLLAAAFLLIGKEERS